MSEEFEWPEGFDPDVIEEYPGGDFVRDLWELNKEPLPDE